MKRRQGSNQRRWHLLAREVGEGIPEGEAAHLPSATGQPGEREGGCGIWDQEGWVRQGELLPWWGRLQMVWVVRRWEVSSW